MNTHLLLDLSLLLQADGGGGEGEQGGGWMQSLILMGGVVLILYFFMIRPQMQRQKKEKQFRSSIAKGDKVVTIGGIHGTITSLDESSLLLEIDQGTKIRIDREAVKSYETPAGHDSKNDNSK